jgi:hypothetical protein
MIFWRNTLADAPNTGTHSNATALVARSLTAVQKKRPAGAS